MITESMLTFESERTVTQPGVCRRDESIRGRGVRLVMSLPLLLLALALSIAPVGAQTDEGNTDTGPSQEELKNSKDRAIYIEPMIKEQTEPRRKEPRKASTDIKPGAKRQTRKSTAKTSTRRQSQAPTKKASTNSHDLKGQSHGAATSTTKMVNYNRPATFNSLVISAALDKPGPTPRYDDGEKITVRVQAHQRCHILIFDYDGSRLTQLFPNQYQTDSAVRAGESIVVGGPESSFDFQASNDSTRPSKEKIFIYAYPTGASPAPLTLALNPVASSPFRSTDMTPEEYRKLIDKCQVFFSRSVKVVPKKTIENASFEAPAAPPNKIELPFVISARKNRR